jgi:hypothetical protein
VRRRPGREWRRMKLRESRPAAASEYWDEDGRLVTSRYCREDLPAWMGPRAEAPALFP